MSEKQAQENQTLSDEQQTIDLPPELVEIMEKIDRGEQLSNEDECKVLAYDLLNTRAQLEQLREVLGEMVKHLCAVIALRHKGQLKIDKAEFQNFFNKFDAQAMIGQENVTGNPVISIAVRPRKEKKLLVASNQEITAANNLRIIQP